MNIQGEVLPVTLGDTWLVAELENGTVIQGETNIDTRKINPESPIRRIYLDPEAESDDRVRKAILRADAIVIGPGDLYTSVLPNLLVKGVPEAIRESPADIIYVCNLMTKVGETDGFRASDFLEELLYYLGPGGTVDYILLNKGDFPPSLLKRYASEDSFPVEDNLEWCKQRVGRVIRAPFAAGGTLVRHNSDSWRSRSWRLPTSGTCVDRPPTQQVAYSEPDEE